MAKNKNTLDPAQSVEFDEQIRRWQDVLNLKDWRIERGAKAARKAMASVECDPEAMLAVYRVGDFGASEVNSESISMTALHECLHIFLFDLIASAQDPKSSQEQVDMAEHRVINILERLLHDGTKSN